MQIENAVILHGPGRSGTTLLSKILSMNSNFYWISGYCNKFPIFPSLSIFNRIYNYPHIELLTRNLKKMPRPAEAYDFWTYYLPGFNNIIIKKENIDIYQINNCIKAINKIQYWTGKERFITKITGNPRVEYISRLFANPNLIWMERDPRIVVMSYHKQHWNYRRKLEVFYNKSENELIKEYATLYLGFYKKKEKLKKFKFLQLYYEDLILERKKYFKKIFQFIEEKQNKKFTNILESWNIKKNTNKYYNDYFTEEGMKLLNNLLKNPIEELGYDSTNLRLKGKR